MPSTIDRTGLLISTTAHPADPARSTRAFTMDDLRDMPQREAAVTFSCRRSGSRRHHFTGPLLADLAARATAIPPDRRDRLRTLITVHGGDGHSTLLAWAELDPEFAATRVLIAVTRDGRVLDGEGPQLVVPGDHCGARNISGITTIHLCLDAARPRRPGDL
ncbi:hypothetical protein [Actinomadura hibisca]|uniref:hypothetical protein n=1 Tax=Actinomadura hibisca TaxID=68565 RepID=UPI00082FFB31|nr:hypothetical protein [Actinomadura hibisca]